MAYILLILSPIINAFLKVPQKKYQEDTMGVESGVNIYLALNCLFGLVFFATLAGGNIKPNVPTLLFAVVFSGNCILSNVASLLAMRKTDIASMAIFASAGAIVTPIIFGAFFLKEETSVCKWIAVFLLVIIVFMPLFDNRQHKKKSIQGYLYCLLLFIDGGLSTIICKLYAMNPNVLGDNVFCFWTNVFIIPFAIIIISRSGGFGQFLADAKTLSKRTYLYAIATLLMGNALTLTSMYIFKYINIIVCTILTSSLSLISVAVFSRIFFKEKITVRTIVNIVLSIMAIIFNLF